MEFDKIQLIGYVAIIVIVVSLASIGMKFTGFATVTDTGVVNVTISTSAAINFTTDFVNFGTGSVNALATMATVNTEGTLTNGTGWAPTANLTLENIGNVNVSLSLKSDKNASVFIGGANPSFKIKVINDTEPLSCSGNNATVYTEINTTDNSICTNFPFDDTKDKVTIAIQLVVPYNSLTGAAAQTSTITATGTYT
jgi:hypothetical protein